MFRFSLILLLLASCGVWEPDVLAPAGWEVYNAEVESPSPEMAQGYLRAWNCTSLNRTIRPGAPEFHQITWVAVDSIVSIVVGSRANGVSGKDNRIFIVRGRWEDVHLAMHEVLHQMVGVGIPHEDERFYRCDPYKYRYMRYE